MTPDLPQMLAKAFIKEIAPEELDIFDDIIAQSDRKKDNRNRIGQPDLGWGEIELTHAVSGALLFLGHKIVEFLYSHVEDTIKEIGNDVAKKVRFELRSHVMKWIDSRFKSPLPTEIAGENNKKLLKLIHEEGKRSKIDPSLMKEIDKLIRKSYTHE